MKRNGETSVSYCSASADGAQRQLLRAAAGGEQPDADLDEPHVRLGERVHRRRVQADLAAAAERQPVRRRDDRHLRVLHRHHRLLEGLHHERDLVVRPLGDRHRQQHQVRAGRERLALVRDDEPAALRLGAAERPVHHREHVVPDGVHLGVELEAEHAVAEVEHGRARVPLHHRAGLLEDRRGRGGPPAGARRCQPPPWARSRNRRRPPSSA